MITTRTIISGIEYFDYNNLEVSKTTSDLNESSFFDITYDSPYGRHKTDFNVGNEIKIFAGNGVLGNLQGQFRFEEGSGLKSTDEITGVNGSLVSGVSWSQGRIGSALFFSGNSSFIVSGGSLYTSAFDNFSLSFWFKFDNVPTDIRSLVGKGNIGQTSGGGLDILVRGEIGRAH